MENLNLKPQNARYLYSKTGGDKLLKAIVFDNFDFFEDEYDVKDIPATDLLTVGTLMYKDAARYLDPDNIRSE